MMINKVRNYFLNLLKNTLFPNLIEATIFFSQSQSASNLNLTVADRNFFVKVST